MTGRITRLTGTDIPTRMSRREKPSSPHSVTPVQEILAPEDATRRKPRFAKSAQRQTQRPGRPDAAFLAQYIDQHYSWPRRPGRKAPQHQRAERAYLDAEGLPEILAAALRLTVDRRT